MFRLDNEKFLYFLAGTVLVAILWLSIAYFGVAGAVSFCLIFTFILTSFSRLFYAWGRSSSLSLEETWLPPLISLASTAFVSLGIFQLVQFSQTGVLNGVVFYPWLAIILGGPAVYFLPPRVKHYLQLRDQAKNCIESYLLVKHDYNLPICVDELRFVDGVKNRELEIYVSNYKDEDSRDEDEEYSSLSQRIDHATRAIYYEKSFIPARADRLFMSWYSVLEDKYYQGEFPFSFEGFEMRTAKYDDAGNVRLWDHLHRQDAGVVKISIHPNGNVYLYRYSDMLICYTALNVRSISDGKRESLMQHFRPYGKYTTAMVSELKAADKELAASQLMPRGVAQRRAWNWCMRFEGLDENNKLDIDDAGLCSYRCTLEEISIYANRPIPEKIEIMYRSHRGLLGWLFIYLDVESLHRSIQQLTASNNTIPVEFVVTVEDSHNNTIRFLINANGQSATFGDWETTVNEEKKRETRKLGKEARQKKQQYELLDSAWVDFKKGDYQAVEEKCNTILSRKPEVPQVYFLQAHMLWRKEGAAAYLAKIDDFIEKAGEDKHALSRLYNSKGCVLDELKRYAEALPFFEKAASIDPEEGIYLANIAELNYKLGNQKEALSYVQKARKKNFDSDMMGDILKNNGIIK